MESPPRTRSARADARREEILRTAAGLYARSGFHGVSIDDLGDAVGLSGPGLYRYFPTKDAILGAMLVEVSTTLLDGARAVSAASTDPDDALEALIGHHIDFALGSPDLIAVQFRDLDSAPVAARSRVRRLQARYVDIWVATVLDLWPGADPERARSAVHAVFGLLNSTPHSARGDRAAMAALLRRMARGALESAVGT